MATSSPCPKLQTFLSMTRLVRLTLHTENGQDITDERARGHWKSYTNQKTSSKPGMTTVSLSPKMQLPQLYEKAPPADIAHKDHEIAFG